MTCRRRLVPIPCGRTGSHRACQPNDDARSWSTFPDWPGPTTRFARKRSTCAPAARCRRQRPGSRASSGRTSPLQRVWPELATSIATVPTPSALRPLRAIAPICPCRSGARSSHLKRRFERPRVRRSPVQAGNAGGDGKVRRARRRASDQVNRKGGFFVHRFEKILSWTEFMNLHRNVEDDEEASAKKAADDHDEIGIGRLDKKAATRLAIDLDLAPADVDAERLSAAFTYPEWDYRREAYLPEHVRVLERPAEAGVAEAQCQPAPEAARRIRAVRRQFEALRPGRELLGRQLDGHELDMDELIRSKADMRACGAGSDRVFRQAREQARDLSVAVLIDVSRSTESFVEEPAGHRHRARGARRSSRRVGCLRRRSCHLRVLLAPARSRLHLAAQDFRGEDWPRPARAHSEPEAGLLHSSRRCNPAYLRRTSATPFEQAPAARAHRWQAQRPRSL